jgi:hypothetical protein
MDRRRHPRVAAEMSVHVWGIDSFSQPFAVPARVKNISASGMVICGVTRSIRVGSVLEAKLEQEKAQFCVVWVGKHGGRQQGEVGLARLAAEPYLFEVCASYLGAAAGHG